MKLIRVCFLSLLMQSLMAVSAQAQVVLNEENFPDPGFRSYISYLVRVPVGGTISREKIDFMTDIRMYDSSMDNIQGIEFFDKLDVLECQNCHLNSLDVSKNARLTHLTCTGNNLTTLDISANKELVELNCSDNELTTLDISANNALKAVMCNGNHLTALDVSANTVLMNLNCSSNQIEKLDVSNNPKLGMLLCNDNQLAELALANNPALWWLECNNNQLQSLDVTSNDALRYLYFNGNHIREIDLSDNPVLAFLTCSENELEEIDFSGNGNLSLLWCSNNHLSSLDFTGIENLWSLYCDGNNIQGDGMDVLINSLHVKGDGQTKCHLQVFNADNENEGNVCTDSQVATAKEKGWDVKQILNGEWLDYEGLTGIDAIALGSLTDKPVYDLNGRKNTTGHNGVNIIDGKKFLRR